MGKRPDTNYGARKSSFSGGHGAKRRRKEYREAKFRSEAPAPAKQASDVQATNDEKSDSESSDDATPYTKLLGILRKDVVEDEEDEVADDSPGYDEDEGVEAEEGEEVEEVEEGDEGDEGEDDDDGEQEEEHDGSEENENDDDNDSQMEQKNSEDGDDDRDGPAALKELGLDATEQSEDSEHSDDDDLDASGHAHDSFMKSFQEMKLDEETANSLEQKRASTKWRKKEVDGLPCPLLWRPGTITSFPNTLEPDDDIQEALDRKSVV